MKKLTFLVYHKEYEEFLNSLRELGVVHIVEKQQVAADNTELQENIRLSNRLAATLKLLQNQKHEKNAVIATEGGTATRGMQVLDEVDALQTEHGKLSQQLQSYAKEKEALEAWGNFEPDNVQKLKDAGYVIGFYSCSEGNYKEEWETEYNAMIINRISSKVFFVTLTKAGRKWTWMWSRRNYLHTLCHVLKRFTRPNRPSKGMKRSSLHFPRRKFLP